MSFLCRYAHSALARYVPFSSDLTTTPSKRSLIPAAASAALTRPSRSIRVETEDRHPAVYCLDTIPLRSSSPLRRGKTVVSSTGLECSVTQPSQIAGVLQNVRDRLLPANTANSGMLGGVGLHLGLPVQWTLSIGPDGAFVEKIIGEKVSYSFGSSGLTVQDCWEVDHSGIARASELDDGESCLLTTWIRSGQWLHDSVNRQLHIEIDAPTSPQTVAMDDEAKPLGASSEMGSSGDKNMDCADTSSTQRLRDTSGSTIDLRVRLKTGKVRVTVRVDRSTWLPIEVRQDLFGDRETWLLKNWQLWDNADLLYPEEIIHSIANGGYHEYRTVVGTSLSQQKHDASHTASVFAPPKLEVTPTNYVFDNKASNSVPAWKAPSCHILVRPVVNGKDLGYMIVDTGASGLVLDKAAADSLNLESYGELFVAGVSGKIPAHFRTAKSLVLGPLTVTNPQFMEMSVPGLVTDAFKPLVGILGYDVLRRAVVEMKSSKSSTESSSASATEPNFLLKLHDVNSFCQQPMFRDAQWFPLHMVTNLPHIKAKFSTDGRTVYEGLFMIDTGAGGACVMFMSRAVAEFGLLEDLETNVKAFVKGVGGSQVERQPVRSGFLAWFELGVMKLSKVSCLFFDDSKMDISVYACGILCMNMLHQNHTIIDYSRQRVAVLPADQT